MSEVEGIDTTGVQALVDRALHVARWTKLLAENEQELHRRRSQAFVAALARELAALDPDPAVRVFHRHNPENRAQFGLHELLHDITVCRVGHVAPDSKHVYIEDALWQVESELRALRRHALLDFNKLVLGSAPRKLFVGPKVKDLPAWRELLGKLAARCTGQVYFAAIPRPAHWMHDRSGAEVWRLPSRG